MNADDVLIKLKKGNQRFTANQRTYPNQDKYRMQEVLNGQKPMATVLCCSDSRVPPEHIFDAGLGDLFTVRVAGNIFDEVALGSIEYGMAHLKTPLLVVLGHTQCGAVTAAVQGGEAEGHIRSLVEKIAPAVDTARQQFPHNRLDEILHESIRINVQHTMSALQEASPIIHEGIEHLRFKMMGALYDMKTGQVDWLA